MVALATLVTVFSWKPTQEVQLTPSLDMVASSFESFASRDYELNRKSLLPVFQRPFDPT